jgi:hypothetical protein
VTATPRLLHSLSGTDVPSERKHETDRLRVADEEQVDDQPLQAPKVAL